MKPRKEGSGTPFRTSQARELMVGLLRTLAPRMVSRTQLRAVLEEVIRNEKLWRELDEQPRELEVHGTASTPATSSVMTAPVTSRVAEQRAADFAKQSIEGGFASVEDFLP